MVISPRASHILKVVVPLIVILRVALFHPSPPPTLEFLTPEVPPFNSKVLIYITTLYSDSHRRYFNCCWPRLLSESRLFRNSHFIVFSNNMTSIDASYLAEVEDIFVSRGVKSFEFKFADGTPELEVLENYTRREEVELQQSKNINKLLHLLAFRSPAKQWGANMALSIGFSAGWFQPYDWVVRVNPDVLIRQSDFIVDHLDDSSIDAIVAHCKAGKLETDFFAVRPGVLKPDAFRQMYAAATDKAIIVGIPKMNHEATAMKNFLPILEANRYKTVPNLAPMEGKCRVRGDEAPVYHAHDSKSMFVCQ